MKKLTVFITTLVIMVMLVPAGQASAQSYYYAGNEQQLIQYLQQLILQLQAQLQVRNTYTTPYGNTYRYYYDQPTRWYDDDHDTVVVGRPRSYNSSGDDDPVADTQAANDIEDNTAELVGEVDMNDFNNGEVFFVYGEDESQVEDVEDDYDSYADVDEDGDDLQKHRVDSDLDGSDRYRLTVYGLDEDTDYFYQICVGYEDEDDDDTLECGGVEDFTTDDNGYSSSDDEPQVWTNDARNIDDDSAELRGEVDMNDYRNGTVFFVYGEDESQVEDVEDDYDTYHDVDEDGDDLQKVLVDSDLDGSSSYWAKVYGLDDNTDHYFSLCVEWDDGDELLTCGSTEHFETD